MAPTYNLMWSSCVVLLQLCSYQAPNAKPVGLRIGWSFHSLHHTIRGLVAVAWVLLPSSFTGAVSAVAAAAELELLLLLCISGKSTC